ncbi:MAG TPA: redoxin domain-containing protein [Candidatus Paceibacterota bacterium]|nr:redoxin domain-containing protein [Candidatus Paceibacterota bacterium]
MTDCNDCTNCGPMRIGAKLPEMKLNAYHPKKDDIITIETSSLAGKWSIFMFYPADFTFVCPTELEEMAELYEGITKENAEVFSVSTDTAFAHKAWHDSSPAIKKVQFPMIGDPTGELALLFDVYIHEEGMALRGTFIVDPDGVLRTMEVHDNSIGRSAKETLRKLRAAKFVREHGGNVCPAAWEPGAETLQPGIKLVGKI